MADSERVPNDGVVRPGALMISSDVDRWGNKTMISADRVWTKVSGKDTDGAWAIFESCVPAGLAVPLHLHHDQDEWFWVLYGGFVFEVSGETYRLSAGMSLFAPRQLPHRWRKTSDADGRLLLLVQPAERLEEFFARFADLRRDKQQDLDIVSRLFSECGMELLGPPLPDEIG